MSKIAEIEINAENINKIEDIRKKHKHICSVKARNNIIYVEYNDVEIMGGNMQKLFMDTFKK